MNEQLVMTVIGPDRPGIIESVAAVVAGHGGNWMESRMCRLGGEFAGILRAEIPPGTRAKVAAQLLALEGRGLKIVVRADASAEIPAPVRLVRMELVGQDRPGIVKEISGVFARAGVNVEELRTECASAPMSGEMMFKAWATLGIPDGCDEQSVRADLERLADNLLVDVELEPAGDG